MNFDQKVWRLCSKIPRGKVSTYKEIAKALRTDAYRAVGRALKRNPYAPRVPCHRVVAADGRIGGFAGRRKGKKISKKISLLRKEGIKIKNSKIINFEKKVHRF